MPDRLKAILEKIKEWWLKFTTKQKTLLISITAVVISCIGDTGCRDDQTYDGSADNL